MGKVSLIFLALTMLAALDGAGAAAPMPLPPVPSERQLRWHQLGVYAFIHFGLNTFTDKEWGYGDEPESLFNPTDFDARRVVRTLKQAGMRGVILTCKHHDGFCLWPSRFTTHSVRKSPWRNGHGDMVREFSEACRSEGLLFGVYLSPWDRNSAVYGTPAYITYYRNQLRELLTGYGPLFEVWFDGANGGDGFYGGAREHRSIDNRTYYDWENTWQLVRELQPRACMFSDAGPDVRWVGNEEGHAGDPCWATLNTEGKFPGRADPVELNHGDRPGTHWLPAEVDVSIRPGWFYHSAEDSRVKSSQELMKIYLQSVGRGANLILNVPLDRRGHVHEQDERALAAWGSALRRIFRKNLARGASASASSVFNNDRRYAADGVLVGRRFWAAADGDRHPELRLDLHHPVTFNLVRLREYLPLGQRVDSFTLEWSDGVTWQPLATGTSIGSQRLVLTPAVTAKQVRIRMTGPVPPAIAEFSLFSNL